MSKRYDCRDPQERVAGIEAAVTAARAGELIVLPTDTVYGIGADAFTPAAVTTMLAAKGRAGWSRSSTAGSRAPRCTGCSPRSLAGGTRATTRT
jgi:hypothetical protein